MRAAAAGRRTPSQVDKAVSGPVYVVVEVPVHLGLPEGVRHGGQGGGTRHQKRRPIHVGGGAEDEVVLPTPRPRGACRRAAAKGQTPHDCSPLRLWSYKRLADATRQGPYATPVPRECPSRVHPAPSPSVSHSARLH